MSWITLVFLLVLSPSTMATPPQLLPPQLPLPPSSLLPPQGTRLPSTSPPSAPTTSPTQPISGDLVVQYYNKTISTQELLTELNMTHDQFNVSKIICPSLSYSCETVCPMNGSNEAQERKLKKPCYCDKLCIELGDCCYDYFLSCAADLTLKSDLSRYVCVKKNKADFHGYALIGRCPAENSEKSLESLYTATSPSLELPVLDLDDNSVYKNIFCAKCNHATNLVYFKFSASCKRFTAHDIPKNRTLMLEFIEKNCMWRFIVPHATSPLKNCLAVKVACKTLHPYNSQLSSLCSFYTFPVCHNINSKNPHCEICRGNDISAYFCDCDRPPKHSSTNDTEGGPLPLDILFDFSSTHHTVKIGQTTITVENKECVYGFAFDPFTEKCIRVYVMNPQTSNNGSFVGYNCDGSGFVKIDLDSIIVLSNGSILIPLHKRTYTNGSYFINGSVALVCMNRTRDFTEITTTFSTDANFKGKQIITYVSCTISMVSLILLLGVYITFSELRTLLGKNLMSLSSSMLLYHTVFLMTGQTAYPSLCTVVSVLLHYFLLSSFCWMSVMAFDVAKTFRKSGKTSPSARSGSSKMALIKYHGFAWTTPGTIVITSYVLDKSGAVYIGYGQRICWISNGKALLVVLGAPVALILIFNSVAISITLLSIWKVQKGSSFFSLSWQIKGHVIESK